MQGTPSLKSNLVDNLLDKNLLPHKVANSLSVFWQFHQISPQFDRGGKALAVRGETCRELELFSVVLNLKEST